MNMDKQRRAEFLGCPVDCLTSSELLAELAADIRAHAPVRVIQFMNANKVAMVRSDPSMGELLRRADYVLADGQPMLPLAAMLGLRIPERRLRERGTETLPKRRRGTMLRAASREPRRRPPAMARPRAATCNPRWTATMEQ